LLSLHQERFESLLEESPGLRDSLNKQRKRAVAPLAAAH
jgi:hypothetical protein